MAEQRSVMFDMDFEVKNLKSIESLENYLEEVNSELKTLDASSDAFKKLSAKAREADASLKTVNTQLEGVTGPEMAEGVVKLTDGLVGGFQIAASASLIFGEKTSEQLEKTIAKVAALFAAMDGVKKITEALSAQNLKFVKGAIDGFKKSAVAVKLFGSTTRTALISTGIGALIVAVGLLIANFDKLSAAVKKNGDKIKNVLKFIAPPIYLLVEGVEALIKKFGDLQNLVASVGAFIKSVFTFDGSGLDGAVKAFNETLEIEKELDDLRKDYNDKITKTTEEYQEQKELLSLMGNKEQEILNLEKDRNKAIVDNLKKRQELKELGEEDVEVLKAAELELKKLEIRQDNLNKKVAEQNKAEQEKLKTLKEQGIAKALQLEKEKAQLELNNRRASLDIAMQQVQQDITKLTFDEEQAILNSTNQREDYLDLLYTNIDALNSINDKTIEVLGNESLRIKNLENYIGKMEDLQNEVNNIKPPTEDSEKLLSILQNINAEYTKQRDIIDQVNSFIDSYSDNFDGVKGIVYTLNEEERKSLAILEGQKAIIEQNKAIMIEELDLLREQNNIRIQADKQYLDLLDSQNELLEGKLNANAEELKGIEIEHEKVLAMEDGVEKQVALLRITEQYNKISAQGLAINAELDATKQEIVNTTNEIKQLERENNKIIGEATAIYEEQNDALKEQEKILANNAHVYSSEMEKAAIQVGAFIKDNAEQILQTSMEGIQASFDIINAVRNSRIEQEAVDSENRIRRMEEEAEAYIRANEDALNEIADLRSDLADQESDLNDLLRDAEGDRYNDILAQIEEVKAQDAIAAEQEKQIKNQQIANDNAIADARYKQEVAARDNAYETAKAEKKQAIILATINTALAVVKALPNIPLSIIAGVLGAAGVVAIAASKVVKGPDPKKPTLQTPIAEKGGLLEGPSHAQGGVAIEAEGGEYIINKDSTAKYRSLLEAINRPKFADGGIVETTPTTISAPEQELFDYDRLAMAVAKQPIFASWSEGQSVGRKIEMVESRSSI